MMNNSSSNQSAVSLTIEYAAFLWEIFTKWKALPVKSSQRPPIREQLFIEHKCMCDHIGSWLHQPVS